MFIAVAVDAFSLLKPSCGLEVVDRQTAKILCVFVHHVLIAPMSINVSGLKKDFDAHGVNEMNDEKKNILACLNCPFRYGTRCDYFDLYIPHFPYTAYCPHRPPIRVGRCSLVTVTIGAS